MAFQPNDSAIKVDAALEESLAGASFEEIKAHLSAAAIRQQLVVPDIYDNSVLIPTERANAAHQKVSKVVVINGREHTIVGKDADDVQAQELEIMRQAFAGRPATEQSRDDSGKFIPEIPDPTTRIESDLVNRALEAQGIDPDALREFSENRQTQSWETAVEAFKEQHPSWQGGKQNTETIGKLIVNSPEVMAGLSPSQCIEKAYEYARDNNLLVESEESAQFHRLQSARSPEELRAALGRDSSGFFGH